MKILGIRIYDTTLNPAYCLSILDAAFGALHPLVDDSIVSKYKKGDIWTIISNTLVTNNF